jgi:hypothetical protein
VDGKPHIYTGAPESTDTQKYAKTWCDMITVARNEAILSKHNGKSVPPQ